MNIAVINGTEVKGCTYRIKETFLAEFRGEHEITEFYLPRDSNHFCIGCKKCFDLGENSCPHAARIGPILTAILAADLIVFAYPVYVLRAPGQIKALLDHLAFQWMPHRPNPMMFGKHAVILTQSIGAPNGAAQKDVKTSLRWQGVSSIRSLGFGLVEGIVWDKLSEKKRRSIEAKTRVFARKIRTTAARKARKGIKVRLIFTICRLLQNKTLKSGRPIARDTQYWIDQGWLKPLK